MPKEERGRIQYTVGGFALAASTTSDVLLWNAAYCNGVYNHHAALYPSCAYIRGAAANLAQCSSNAGVAEHILRTAITS